MKIEYKSKEALTNANNLWEGILAIGYRPKEPEMNKKLFNTEVLITVLTTELPLPDAFWNFIKQYAELAKLDEEYLKVYILDPQQGIC